MMAFIGVRISWLMFARNMDFICVASSAFAFASRNSSAIRFWSLMSTSRPINPPGLPSVA